MQAPVRNRLTLPADLATSTRIVAFGSVLPSSPPTPSNGNASKTADNPITNHLLAFGIDSPFLKTVRAHASASLSMALILIDVWHSPELRLSAKNFFEFDARSCRPLVDCGGR